jgi:hypothetical protein
MFGNVDGGMPCLQFVQRTALDQGMNLYVEQMRGSAEVVYSVCGEEREAQETKQQPTRTVFSLSCLVQTRLRFTRTGGRIGT